MLANILYDLITSVLFAGAIGITIYTVVLLRRRPHTLLSDEIELPFGIPVDSIGKIEKELAHLKSVIVIADHVERPHASLLEAVEYNFSRGVQYLFLISADRAQETIEGYYRIFEHFARMALRASPVDNRSLSDLIDIKQLPYNWDDYPYIFYRVEVAPGHTKTLAFRGDVLRKGIAAHYGRIEPALAHTIARSIVSEAPQAVPTLVGGRHEFDDSGKVTKFPILVSELKSNGKRQTVQ